MPTGTTSPNSRTGLFPECLWLCLPVGCWVLAGVALGPLLFHKLATDDYPRLVLSMQWARTPFLAPIDRYWLPLPYWIYGSWYSMAGRGLGLYAHLPLSGGLIGLSVAFLMGVCHRLASSGSICKPVRFPIALWLTFALPFSIPILYYVATSGLSETVYLPSLALLMLTMTLFIGNPTWQGRLLLVAAAVVFQLSRYEGWPLSFTALGIAQLFTWRKTSFSPRQWPGWIISYLVLCVVPAIWMILNYQAHGEALHFLAQADDGAKLDTALSTYGLAFRLKFLLRHAIEQGWLILALAAASMPMLRKNRRALALVLFATAAWGLYFEAAFANTVGVARSERFCLGPLLSTLPLAVMGGQWLRGHMKAMPLRGLMFLMAFLVAFMLNYGFHKMLRHPFVDEPTYARLLDLRQQTHKNGLIIVIADPVTFEHPGANLFRFYLGLDAVAMLDWYSPATPVPGNFLYFPGPNEQPIQAGKRLLGKPYIKLTRMPPPTGSLRQ